MKTMKHVKPLMHPIQPTLDRPRKAAPRRGRLAAMALCGAALSLAFTGLCPFAGNVQSYQPGPLSAGSTANALGAPTGGGLFNGSFDTLTLGVGGSVTLELSTAGFDGPGTDLIVCENPFYVASTNGIFVEAMFVEVSTDAVHFARFPTHYSGPTGPFVPTFGAPVAWYRGFAGVLPVFANGADDPRTLDVVGAGGDAFDYADLASDPAVLAGTVDLHDIEYVRLTDAQAGTAHDSAGHTVWDCGLDNFAAADLDAIIGVNSQCVPASGRPQVEMSLASGFLTIRIQDEDGFQDIKHGLTASVNGLPIPFTSLLPFFAITQLDAQGITLVTGPVPPGAFPVTLKISAQDAQGQFGGDALTLP